MPVSAYFQGHGDEVMTKMIRQYGKKKGKAVFYATANKRKKAKRFPEDSPFSNVLPDYKRIPNKTH